MNFKKCRGCSKRDEGCQSRCPYYVANLLVLIEQKEQIDSKKKKENLISRTHVSKKRSMWLDV